jgi:hypothetical protein
LVDRGQEARDLVQFVARNALTKAQGKNRAQVLEERVPTLGLKDDDCTLCNATQ